MKDYAACQKVVDQFPADALRAPGSRPAPRRWQCAMRATSGESLCRLDRGRPRAISASYQEAIKILRQAQDDPLGEVAIRQSMYLIGVCLLEMGDSTAALAQFQRTRGVYLDTLGGTRRGFGRGRLAAVSAPGRGCTGSYRQVLGGIREKPPFANRWITPKKFRARVLEAYQYYLEGQHYDQAVRLAERMAPLFPRSQSVQLVARPIVLGHETNCAVRNVPEPQASRDPPPQAQSCIAAPAKCSSIWR